MKKLVFVPDSFKGTMTSLEICEQMRCAARALWPQVQTEEIPVADGGEGSVDAFLGAVGGSKEFARVQGPYGEEMEAFYGCAAVRLWWKWLPPPDFLWWEKTAMRSVPPRTEWGS